MLGSMSHSVMCSILGSMLYWAARWTAFWQYDVFSGMMCHMMRWAAYWTACGAAYQPKLRKYAVVDGIMCTISG